MALCAIVLAGCSPKHYKDSADREAYRILAAKRARVLGAKDLFSIDLPKGDPLERLRTEQQGASAPARKALSVGDRDLKNVGDDGLPKWAGALRLTLRQALELAARHSREYQGRKEQLYLSALDLSLQRHQWKPQWSGDADAGATDGADDFVEGGSSVSVTQLLALGGQVSASVATDLLKFTTGDRSRSATTAVAAQVLQPLWRGAGRLVARENLTQAERSTVYDVRSFARFRKIFCIQITSDYYGVLRARDAVTNQWQSRLRNQQVVELTRDKAAAGRLSEFEVDRARQNELRARDSWVRALRNYYQALDRFKVRLSLPADAAVELDPAEVERLRTTGLHEAKLPLDRGIMLALRKRLDLLNAIDRVADSERRLVLAVNGLGPDVDLTLSAAIPSDGQRKPLRIRPSQGTYSIGLDADLPLDRKSERNTYRRALIDLDQARRTADEQRDNVTLGVREAWRNLRETAERYRIQIDSVRLAERRVESTTVLLQGGRANTRAVLDANDDLVAAKNAVTSALIDNTLARLALWRDTELLRVGADGVWQEVTNADLQQ